MFGEDAVVEEVVDGEAPITQVGNIIVAMHPQQHCNLTTAITSSFSHTYTQTSCS
jgi:hypothetical protein